MIADFAVAKQPRQQGQCVRTEDLVHERFLARVMQARREEHGFLLTAWVFLPDPAAAVGAGVIWNGDPLEPPVIPAKAGIQFDDSTFPKVCGVDSRFRGNDWVSPNDTKTRRGMRSSRRDVRRASASSWNR